MKPPLDHHAIALRVPHAGAMCLLDAVTAWDASTIECRAAAPRADHPLARDGVLPAIAAIEYAAQASAVHGALLQGGVARAGLLAKLTDIELHAASIALDGAAPVEVRAQRLSHSDAGCLYAFEVGCAGAPVASGRLLVAFAKAAP